MDGLGKDYALYLDAWTKTQLTIWMEKIERLKIVRSGRLHQSFRSAIQSATDGTEITMKFYKYGIYQEMGVGKYYRRGNGGDLPFLGREYREEHGLNKKKKVGPKWGGYLTSGQPRKKRKWFNRYLMRSFYVMREDLARIVGEQCAHVICNAIVEPNQVLR